MAEALSLVSGQKASVAEYYSAKNLCPENSTSNNAGGIAKPSEISGKYVLSVTVKEDKTQTIMLGSNGIQSICGVVAKMRSTGVNGNLVGSELGLYMAVTSGSFQWGCISNALKQYLPASCQN
ncbi:pilin [Entomomonas sp. E2T0]|nr:pilin [Entomomonas sp. E2T0]